MKTVIMSAVMPSV